MPFAKRRKALCFTPEDLQRLIRLRRSRSEERRKVLRASILLDSLEGLSDQTVADKNGVNRNTVVLCISKCLQFGLEAALNDFQRPGKPAQLTDDAKAWVLQLACQKPKDLGYSYELWTYQLLTHHIRQQGVSAGYPSLQKLSRSKLHHLLKTAELRPHKVRYYVEKRDPNFEPKMANVLHVYKEVEISNDGLIHGRLKELPMVTLSYDEKPGIHKPWPMSALRSPRFQTNRPRYCGTTSMCGMGLFPSWPALICTRVRSPNWSATLTTAKTSSNS